MFDIDLKPLFYGFLFLAGLAFYGLWTGLSKPTTIVVKEVNGTKLYCPKGFKLEGHNCIKTINAKEIK